MTALRDYLIATALTAVIGIGILAWTDHELNKPPEKVVEIVLE